MIYLTVLTVEASCYKNFLYFLKAIMTKVVLMLFSIFKEEIEQQLKKKKYITGIKEKTKNLSR